MVTTVLDAGAVAAAAAERMTASMGQAIRAHGSAIVSLTGGRTPRRLYALLADPARPWRARIDWTRVHLFWGDERHVPPDHPDSNFGLARDALVRHVPIPASQIYRMRGELPAAGDAARDYDDTLRVGFAAAGRSGCTFDLMLLGIGEDAHIASIFPGSRLLAAGGDSSALPAEPADRQPARRVAAVWAQHLESWRITLTPAAILDARTILVIASGSSKAEAIRAAIEQPANLKRWPAQLLRAAGERVTWIIDRPAAARLRQAPNEP